jgi:hypothetical protein
MKPKALVVIAVIVLFVAFLTWTTLSAQKVSCNVCVLYNGARNCASASNETEDAAGRAAQTTACGPVTHGMNDAIACEGRPPVTRTCHTR